MLQRTRRNTIGQSSTRVHDVSGLPALIRASVLIFVIVCRFSYQFSSVICAFSSENIILIILLYNLSHEPAKYSEKAGW